MTIDLNTFISSASLLMIAWTLKTVHDVSKDQAAAKAHAESQDERINENRARIMETETRVSNVELSVARIQERHQ
jgi:hypothetical protein